MVTLSILNFEIEALISLEVTKKIGEHSYCNFKALVKDDKLDKYFDKLENNIVIKYDEKIIFSGPVLNIETEKLNGNSLLILRLFQILLS